MPIDALILHPEDNVATAIADLEAGYEAICRIGEDTECCPLTGDIPYGHKFARTAIAEGQDIIKYGEVIGRASRPIARGEHAHVQNIVSLRGRGDLGEKGDQ